MPWEQVVYLVISMAFTGEDMIRTIEELLEAIEAEGLKEHSQANVELKKDWDQKYGRKISALANKIEFEITWLVIGMEDDGRLGG
jgi:hypothetical protein